MSQLFNRVAAFTDLHIGAKSNSSVHNQDCSDFIDWFISEAKRKNCDTGIFLGDWSHNRSTISLPSLNLSIQCLEKLGASFEQFFWFPGNHDLFFKDRRDIHSSSFAHHIPGITVVNKPTTIKSVTLLPWLVGNEWKNASKHPTKYVFGHLELPQFYLNSMIQMPDHGHLKLEDFEQVDYVFSGHFHKRQLKGNIHYIGNAFPHSYSDAQDDDRGMMTLDWNGEPEYTTWPNQPVYRVFKLSQIIDNPKEHLKEKMYCRVVIDVDISFEEANDIKDTLIPEYGLRDLMLIPEKSDIYSDTSEPLQLAVESVDSMVVKQISTLDSNSFDNSLLLDIYTDL